MVKKAASAGALAEDQAEAPQTEPASAAIKAAAAQPVPERPPVDIHGIESRFLYVDVASQRAKQLRRGALPRLDGLAPVGAPDPSVPRSKVERIAMREVDAGKINYELPDDDDPAPAD